MGFKIESSLLDACALAILHRGDTYGYEITQEMKKSITVSESTLYPVLRRLQSEELCRTYDQPYQGRNRRYYSITEKGEEKLRDYLTQWYQYRNAIQTLLEGPAKKEEPEDNTELEVVTESRTAKETDGAGETTDLKEKDEKKAGDETTDDKEKDEKKAGSENAELSDKRKQSSNKAQSGNKTQSGKRTKSGNKTQNKGKTGKVKKDRKEKKEGGAADE